MIENFPMLAFFGMPGWFELLLVAFVGLLLFGKRLPEVARSLGQSVVEFKQGLQGFKQEVDNAGKPVAKSNPTPTAALPEAHTSSPHPQASNPLSNDAVE